MSSVSVPHSYFSETFKHPKNNSPRFYDNAIILWGIFSLSLTEKFGEPNALLCKFSVESKKLYFDELAVDLGQVVDISVEPFVTRWAMYVYCNTKASSLTILAVEKH